MSISCSYGMGCVTLVVCSCPAPVLTALMTVVLLHDRKQYRGSTRLDPRGREPRRVGVGGEDPAAGSAISLWKDTLQQECR